MSGPAPAGLGGVRAVLFDIDDTLVDFAASAAAGLVQLLGPDAAARDGLSDTWHTLTERHYPRFLAGEVPFTQMQIDRMVELLTWAGLPVPDRDGLLALEERRQQEMTRHYRLFDDVRPCLEALGDHRRGVVSNSDGPHQRAKLASVGLADAFEVVVISGEVGHPKPDARIFREACRRLALPPAAVAYVGDRLDVDAHGAAAAGLHGVWLDRGTRADAGARPPAAVGPDAPPVTVITGLDELPGLLAPA
ncbi:HAD family hydrolase [Nakamurella deserti]|uniref:HAD family hydrolase n=1 Tax=Nakamurella deserti TaxID=2164074 RepID=UPI0013001BF7|nr:HAD family hydrolase [Nakamurella deserti]